MTEKLDSDWKELLPIVTATKKTKSDPEPDTKKDDKFADFDVLSKKLKFETRGKVKHCFYCFVPYCLSTFSKLNSINFFSLVTG